MRVSAIHLSLRLASRAADPEIWSLCVADHFASLHYRGSSRASASTASFHFASVVDRAHHASLTPCFGRTSPRSSSQSERSDRCPSSEGGRNECCMFRPSLVREGVRRSLTGGLLCKFTTGKTIPPPRSPAPPFAQGRLWKEKGVPFETPDGYDMVRYAEMNRSRSPSMTAWMLPFSAPVRWSLTSVYGWKTYERI